jgi:hypothetical protein
LVKTILPEIVSQGREPIFPEMFKPLGGFWLFGKVPAAQDDDDRFHARQLIRMGRGRELRRPRIPEFDQGIQVGDDLGKLFLSPGHVPGKPDRSSHGPSAGARFGKGASTLRKRDP